MEAGLERDVDEKDGGDKEVGGVVDGVVPQAGLQLAQERELPRLGEALQADKRVIIMHHNRLRNCIVRPKKRNPRRRCPVG